MLCQWEIMSAYMILRSLPSNQVIGAAIQNEDQTVHAVEFAEPYRYSRLSTIDDASEWLRSLAGIGEVSHG